MAPPMDLSIAIDAPSVKGCKRICEPISENDYGSEMVPSKRPKNAKRSDIRHKNISASSLKDPSALTFIQQSVDCFNAGKIKCLSSLLRNYFHPNCVFSLKSIVSGLKLSDESYKSIFSVEGVNNISKFIEYSTCVIPDGLIQLHQSKLRLQREKPCIVSNFSYSGTSVMPFCFDFKCMSSLIPCQAPYSSLAKNVHIEPNVQIVGTCVQILDENSKCIEMNIVFSDDRVENSMTSFVSRSDEVFSDIEDDIVVEEGSFDVFFERLASCEEPQDSTESAFDAVLRAFPSPGK